VNYYCYILSNKNRTLQYVGFTKDLEKELKFISLEMELILQESIMFMNCFILKHLKIIKWLEKEKVN